MKFGDRQSNWARRTEEAIKPLVEEINERESMFEQLQKEIKTR
jgi:hypothetical protein